jgi:hypothetical protein
MTLSICQIKLFLAKAHFFLLGQQPQCVNKFFFFFKFFFWLAMPYLLRPFTGYYIMIQLQYYIRTTITLEMPARVHGKPCIVPSMSLSSSLRSPH